MANALYDKGREKFLRGELAWQTHDIRCALVTVTAGYTVDLATHEFYSSVTDVIATSALLGSKTTTAGVADAAKAIFSAVGGLSDGEAVIIYRDTGNPATSPLIAYIDTATGLPVTPNGGDIEVLWDTGANKIFKL